MTPLAVPASQSQVAAAFRDCEAGLGRRRSAPEGQPTAMAPLVPGEATGWTVVRGQVHQAEAGRPEIEGEAREAAREPHVIRGRARRAPGGEGGTRGVGRGPNGHHQPPGADEDGQGRGAGPPEGGAGDGGAPGPHDRCLHALLQPGQGCDPRGQDRVPGQRLRDRVPALRIKLPIDIGIEGLPAHHDTSLPSDDPAIRCSMILLALCSRLMTVPIGIPSRSAVSW